MELFTFPFRNVNKGDNHMLFLLGVVFLALGVLAILKPSVIWYLDERWKVKGKFEPSDLHQVHTV
ncbi:DUF6199 family natural product biosynthesis protein [Paenibacillus tuaregi]|uniref:DUF6199 family natural product biosynthesis protein n=1 Tax=Paenibacillus tuaregi TaxID=1816681 RepID=UPI003709B5EB